jgi:hypothetical protein
VFFFPSARHLGRNLMFDCHSPCVCRHSMLDAMPMRTCNSIAIQGMLYCAFLQVGVLSMSITLLFLLDCICSR